MMMHACTMRFCPHELRLPRVTTRACQDEIAKRRRERQRAHALRVAKHVLLVVADAMWEHKRWTLAVLGLLWLILA